MDIVKSAAEKVHSRFTIQTVHSVGLQSSVSSDPSGMIALPMVIAVGRGPSGPSIEGPFCCAVRLYRAL